MKNLLILVAFLGSITQNKPANAQDSLRIDLIASLYYGEGKKHDELIEEFCKIVRQNLKTMSPSRVDEVDVLITEISSDTIKFSYAAVIVTCAEENAMEMFEYYGAGYFGNRFKDVQARAHIESSERIRQADPSLNKTFYIATYEKLRQNDSRYIYLSGGFVADNEFIGAKDYERDLYEH